ncbi:MAG: DUF1294 domain-containing protein [Oscillibacter sp.]|nr:DUF1294 domain-containing protein [Oscillibacter sp.]
MGESAGLLAVFEPEAKNDFIWAVVGSPWGLLACWLILINVVTFCAFGLDKWKAKRKEKKESVRRIPEKRLLALAALGGSVGALLGMRAFRHKTLHKAFRLGIPAILALQILIPFGLWLYFHVIR